MHLIKTPNGLTSESFINTSTTNLSVDINIALLLFSFRLDLTTKVWSEVAPLQARRRHAQYAVLQQKLYVIGGIDVRTQPHLSVECYDSATNTWTNVAPLNQPRIAGHAVVANGLLYVMGSGLSNINAPDTSRSSVERFDPEMNTWTLV